MIYDASHWAPGIEVNQTDKNLYSHACHTLAGYKAINKQINQQNICFGGHDKFYTKVSRNWDVLAPTCTLAP